MARNIIFFLVCAIAIWYSVIALSLPGKWFKTEPFYIQVGTVMHETHTMFVEQCLGLCAGNDTCKYASFDFNSTACTIYSGHNSAQLLAGGETVHTFSPHQVIAIRITFYSI